MADVLEPTVIVSSRDGAPVPHVPGAERLATLAESRGWIVRQTYARARMPATYRKDGSLKKPEHDLESVAVRMVGNRPGDGRRVGGWAMWHRVEGGSWRFRSANVGGQAMSLGELTDFIEASSSHGDVA